MRGSCFVRYTYNPSTSKWSSLTINAKKKKAAGGSKKRRAKQAVGDDANAMAVDGDVDMDAGPQPQADEEDESDDEQVGDKGNCYLFRADLLACASFIRIKR
jgi:hypothetical protein